ncbi:MAG TPA: MFS transporter [Actinophytocola sp.]|jgi:MFS family permease|uniref:MFS transporter n=1 Tax=Actinophytocola sp. TaxID=1872138 RepID=UPI002DF8BA1F|nr:MFS transporter [Actinophytocola sp.]
MTTLTKTNELSEIRPAADTEPRTRWGAVVAVSLGIVLAALDLTIVAVALPLIGADFGAGPALTQWVLLAYTIPLVALSIPAGRWLDRAGPLPSFLLAVGGFGVASVLIAVAPGFPVLLAGRVLQGLFGSLIGVAGMPIVATSVRPEHRARAMSIVLTLIPLSGVAGPAVGGLLAQAYGWRAVFLVNIPVVVLAALVARRTIPARLGPKAGLPAPGRAMLREALVLGVGATALFLSLDLAGRGGVAGPAGLAVVAIGAVLVWLRLRASRPVIGLLRRRPIALGLTALPMMTAGVGGVNFLVPYFLADTLHAAPRMIGLTLLTMSAAMAVVSPVAGVLADRIGTRPVALAGVLVILGGTAAMLTVGTGAGLLDVAWPLAVIGAGNGLFAGPNVTAILAATPPELTGASSGITALLRTMGFAAGPAIGALAFGVAGGAGAAFHVGFGVLTVAAAVSVAAVLADR